MIGRVPDDDALPEFELPGMPAGLFIPDDPAALFRGADEESAPLPSETRSVQVITAVDQDPGAPYVCEVQPADDVAIRLPTDRAAAYAAVVLGYAMRALYLHGVYAQVRDIMSGRGRWSPGDDAHQAALDLIGDMLRELPDFDDAATAPLRFAPRLRARDGEAAIAVSLGDNDAVPAAKRGAHVTLWTPFEARQHARHVLETAHAADLDNAYRRFAVGTLGQPEWRARAMVADLGKYLPHEPDIAELAERAGRAPRYVKPAPTVAGPPPGARPAGGKKRRKR